MAKALAISQFISVFTECMHVANPWPKNRDTDRGMPVPLHP